MKGISAIREICVQKTKIPCEANTSARYMRYAGNESPRIAGIYTNYNLTTNETPHHHSRPERAIPPSPGQATTGSDTLGKTPYHHSRPERAKALYLIFIVQFSANHPELLPFQGAWQMRTHYTQGVGSHCSPYPGLGAFGPSGRKSDKYLQRISCIFLYIFGSRRFHGFHGGTCSARAGHSGHSALST